MNKEIYQKQYDFELEQRNNIASAINIPMMAITILGGALSAMILGFSYSYQVVTYLFCIFVFMAVCSLSFSLYCAFKSFLGYFYQKLQPPSAISNHYNDLLNWYINNGDDHTSSEEKANKDLEKYINDRLSEAAENNGKNNIARGNYLHESTKFVAISVLFIFIASAFFIFNKIENNHTIYNVNIVSDVKIKTGGDQMSNNGNNSNNSSSQNSTPAPKPTMSNTPPPPKPEGPPNIQFRGNVESPTMQVNTGNTKKE